MSEGGPNEIDTSGKVGSKYQEQEKWLNDLVREHGLFGAALIVGALPGGAPVAAGLAAMDHFDKANRQNEVKSGPPIPYPHVIVGEDQTFFSQDSGHQQTQKSDTKAESEKSGTPSAVGEKFVEDATRPGNEVEEVMLKDPSLWTQDEALTVQGRVAAMASNHPERGHMDEAVRAFYDHHYDADDVHRDATGRMIEPEARRTIPTKTLLLRTPDGEGLDEATRRIAVKIINSDDSPPVVRDLQSGLNLIEADANSRRPPIKTDGTFGPKTRSTFRRVLVTQGPGKIEEALALGKFRALVDQARKTGDTSALKEQTEKTFGPLFRGDDDHTGEKIEAVILQEALNNTIDGRAEKLKVDGDIGAKTQTAFDLASKIKDPDELSRHFGQMLGFLV